MDSMLGRSATVTTSWITRNQEDDVAGVFRRCPSRASFLRNRLGKKLEGLSMVLEVDEGPSRTSPFWPQAVSGFVVWSSLGGAQRRRRRWEECIVESGMSVTVRWTTVSDRWPQARLDEG